MANEDVAVVETLFGLFEADDDLNASVKRGAARLRPLMFDDPDLAFERLCAFSRAASAGMARRAPSETLARCLTIEAFWQHYIDAEVRLAYPTAEGYRRDIEQAHHPETELMAHLRDGIVCHAEFSWLIPAAQIAGLSGQQTLDRLRIRRGHPPVVVLLFPLATLAAEGVTVRRPRAPDAVCQRHMNWSPAGLGYGLTELINGDIPRVAVGSIEWRP